MPTPKLWGRVDCQYLDAEVSSVHVVTQEEISRFFRVSSDLKELHQIVVLPVNITAHGDGSIHLQQVRLRFENLGGARENEECLLLGEAAFAVEVLLQES